LSSTHFEQSSVHPQEDVYMQFYGISFMHQYKQSGRWKAVLDTISSSASTDTHSPHSIRLKVRALTFLHILVQQIIMCWFHISSNVISKIW